ncbi:LTA synthase family protein [Pediococcus parvulus]|uniref:LTA synthase family protein n=1 Tax=Pediococcus parvulus TaxID=54062 RepID=UPI0021A331DE|nr:LTA synthase family protein [Pediococcus parvulus]
MNLIAWKQQKPTDKNIFFTALNHSGFQAHPESLEAAANEYGPATTFMGTLIIKTMDKPSGYSSQRITKIEQKYQGIAKKINKTRKNKSLNSQTVVYVLSESYADPRMLPTVKLTSNPIPYEQEIERTNTSGLMYSPGYGGGTANIEFEALTGLSMNNFDPSMVTPYVFLVPKVNNLPVITDYFKIKNAIHPYTGTTYNRTEVFKKFDFQHFYNFKGDKLTYTKKIGKSQYISDDSAYRQLLKQLNSTSKGQFVQLSTMQNHMPYIPGTYAKNTYKATGKLTKSSLSKVESYSQGLNYTDKALKMLISHVSKMKKHVTIIWYGDHLPGLYYGSLVSGKNATKYDNRLHQTNYFIYSNYHHQSLSHTKIVSPNMFTPMVFAQTNTKVSPYMALLTEINRYVPAAERDKFMNEKGNYISENKLSKKAKQILADYKLIQYDITAGKQYSIKHKNFVK